MNRFGFLGSAGALTATAGSGAAVAQVSPAPPSPAPTAAKKRASTFFSDASMNFIFLNVLGTAYFGLTDVGTLLAIIDQVEDGNAASAFTVLTKYGARSNSSADTERTAGHRVSAREQYLQASNYYYAATYFCDGMGAPEKMLPTWKLSRAAFDAAMLLSDRPVEHVKIPYQGTTLPGYFWKVDASNKRRPLFLMTNGSDGSILDMYGQSGGLAALERGYNVLAVDGPGQGAALWLQGLHFRPDWEAVVTPTVDFALRRPDVDPKRLVLQGISQGGYWAPRAAAFEHRIAACVADPGVVDVSTSWYRELPPPLIVMLNNGEKAAFDSAMTHMPPKAAADLTFRARPYGFTSLFDVFTAVRKYTLAGLTNNIKCPMFIADPDNEQFWPGQSMRLAAALHVPKKLEPFTITEGADYHCEPLAPGLRSQRVFDWIDKTIGYAH